MEPRTHAAPPRLTLPAVVPGIVGLAPRPLVVVFEPRTPDRTTAIRGLGPSPLPYLQDAEARLVAMGATCFGVPCNSAHVFVRRATDSGAWTPRAAFVDMIDATAAAAHARGHRALGILATTGTVGQQMYQRALARHGLTAIVPDPAEQESLVMEAIYGADGIKAGFTDGAPERRLTEAARRLAAQGADGLILGCTEIPLVLRGRTFAGEDRPIALIDATRELAHALAAAAGVPGIAGGMGPEATVDLVDKYGAPPEWVAVLRAITRATVDLAGARRDQDHLVKAAAVAPDLRLAAEGVLAAGATVLVAPVEAAADAAAVSAATGLPLVTGSAPVLGEWVIRATGRLPNDPPAPRSAA